MYALGGEILEHCQKRREKKLFSILGQHTLTGRASPGKQEVSGSIPSWIAMVIFPLFGLLSISSHSPTVFFFSKIFRHCPNLP